MGRANHKNDTNVDGDKVVEVIRAPLWDPDLSLPTFHTPSSLSSSRAIAVDTNNQEEEEEEEEEIVRGNATPIASKISERHRFDTVSSTSTTTTTTTTTTGEGSIEIIEILSDDDDDDDDDDVVVVVDVEDNDENLISDSLLSITAIPAAITPPMNNKNSTPSLCVQPSDAYLQQTPSHSTSTSTSTSTSSKRGHKRKRKKKGENNSNNDNKTPTPPRKTNPQPSASYPPKTIHHVLLNTHQPPSSQPLPSSPAFLTIKPPPITDLHPTLHPIEIELAHLLEESKFIYSSDSHPTFSSRPIQWAFVYQYASERLRIRLRSHAALDWIGNRLDFALLRSRIAQQLQQGHRRPGMSLILGRERLWLQQQQQQQQQRTTVSGKAKRGRPAKCVHKESALPKPKPKMRKRSSTNTKAKQHHALKISPKLNNQQ